jgi:hypothetical protein
MDMKSEIRSAYVAGLSPLQLLMRYSPESHRQCVPAPPDPASADVPRKPSRWKRALLLALILGLAVEAWQLLSRTDETQAAAASAEDSLSGKSALLFLLILGLAIGTGELLSRTDGTRAMTVAAEASASGQSVVRA